MFESELFDEEYQRKQYDIASRAEVEAKSRRKKKYVKSSPSSAYETWTYRRRSKERAWGVMIIA